MDSNKIMQCHECSRTKNVHEFQDNTYGKWMRVHNVNEKTGNAVCTVCGYGSNKKKK